MLNKIIESVSGTDEKGITAEQFVYALMCIVENVWETEGELTYAKNVFTGYRIDLVKGE